VRCFSCASLAVVKLFPFVVDREPFHMHPHSARITPNEIRASNFRLKSSHAELLPSAGSFEICDLFVSQFKEHGWKEKIEAAIGVNKPTQIEVSLRCFNRDDRVCTHGTLFVSCG
jgi:hypothetical protein